MTTIIDGITAKYWSALERGVGGDQLLEGGKRLFEKRRYDSEHSSPFFSVITICLNNLKSLPRVIDSVKNQTFRDFEYVIIDGSSSDGTKKYLTTNQGDIDYFLSEKDNGIYDAINKGLNFSFGNYIVLIHADDILKHDALEAAHRTITSSKCDIALGDSIYINEQQWPVAYKPARNYGEETILRGITGPHEGAFVSACLYDYLGGYDSSYRIAADHKFFRNAILKKFKFEKINRVVNYKEIGGDSFNKEKESEENFRLLREVFPSITVHSCNELYNLKNFKSLNKESCRSLYNLLENGDFPARFYRVFAKALLIERMGDNSQATVNDGLENSTLSLIKSIFTENTILLCIGKIKGISGGAERVLVELANHLSFNGEHVVIACADGKAGNCFYQLNKGIEFVDINEEPFRSFLSEEGCSKLEAEISSIILKSPDDFLKMAIAPFELRNSSSNWSDFNSIFRDTIDYNRNLAISHLNEQIPKWVSQYGNNILRWRNFLKIARPKVIVPFMISCIPQIFLANRNVGLRLILSNHNNPSRDYYTQDEWNPLGLDRLMRLFSVSSSKFSIWLLNEYVGYLPNLCQKNALVIGNPISAPQNISDYRNRKRIMLAVGRLTKIKNFQLLIEVFARLKTEISNWRLEIFGEGPEKENLDAIINKYGLCEHVSIEKPTTKINEKYNRASIFLSSSVVEGFPLTLCEAMSHGLPSLGRITCSGVNVLIKDGYNGLLVDSCDSNTEIENYSNQLRVLIDDFDLRMKFSKNAMKSMIAYSPEIIYKQWEEALS